MAIGITAALSAWLRPMSGASLAGAALAAFAVWGGQVPGLPMLLGSGPDGQPSGFTVKDPLDPAMKTGYRHPFYIGYIAPYDRLFPTSDPALAAFVHRQYALELDQNDNDPAYGWVSIRLPEGIVKSGEDLLQPAACRVFREIVAEPHHANYQHLLIRMFDDNGSVQYDLRRAACWL